MDHDGWRTRFWSAEKDRLRVWGPHEVFLTASRYILKVREMEGIPWRRYEIAGRQNTLLVASAHSIQVKRVEL